MTVTLGFSVHKNGAWQTAVPIYTDSFLAWQDLLAGLLQYANSIGGDGLLIATVQDPAHFPQAGSYSPVLQIGG